MGSSSAPKRSVSEQSAIEERLKQELEKAKLAYESATAQFRNDTSVESAEAARHSAFQNYRRALQLFNDFILSGKLPEDE
jgi:hypothetical protein